MGGCQVEPRGRAVTDSLFQGARLKLLKHVEARSINVPKPRGSGNRAVIMPRPPKKTVQWWVAKMTQRRGGDRVVFGLVQLRFIENMMTNSGGEEILGWPWTRACVPV